MNLLLRYIPLGMLAFLLWTLFHRRAYRMVPWFFVYTAFGVTAGLARLLARLPELSGTGTYYATYYVTEAGYDVLGILVMYEVLHMVLGHLTQSWRVRLIFPAVLVAGIGLSLARAYASPTQFGSGLAFYIVMGEIAVRFVQVIVFAGLVTLVALLGLRWRQYPFGVATGFGVYATISLLTTTKFSDFGTRFTFWWGVTSLVAYSFAVLIWIWFFSVPEKNEAPGSKLSAPTPGVLKEYRDALRRIR